MWTLSQTNKNSPYSAISSMNSLGHDSAVPSYDSTNQIRAKQCEHHGNTCPLRTPITNVGKTSFHLCPLPAEPI